MHDSRARRKGGCAAFVGLCVLLSGCIDDSYVPEDRTDRTPRILTLTHQAGGTHHRGILHEGTWFVSQGTAILSIDPRSGKTRSEMQVTAPGTTGPIVDIVVWRGDLLVVLAESAVARLDLRSSREPVVVELIEAAELGIGPREVAVIGESLYVSGTGGIVRLPDMKRFLQGQGRAGRVASTANGVVTTSDRRVIALEGGEYLGAATLLEPMPPSMGVEGGLAFALQSRDGASVGIMGPDIRERATDVVAGTVRRLRVLDQRLWAVTDSELVCWEVSDGQMSRRESFRLKGGRDIDSINDNYLAVAGSFGRAVLRLHDDATGEGDSFMRVARVPGRLDLAISDQRTIIASSAEGTWSYPIRGKPSLTERKVEVWAIPAKEVTAVWGTARLAGENDEFTRVEVSTPGSSGGSRGSWTPPRDARVWTLAVVDGDLWVGHDLGITVLRQRTAAAGAGAAYPVQSSPPIGSTDDACPVVEIGSVRSEGPVFFLAPLRTGHGASFVSHLGGMGVVEWEIPGSKPKASTSLRRAPSTDAPPRTSDDR